MSGAILNLVRVNLASDTEPEHDYTSGEIFERHEEIALVNPNGCPCAIPRPSSFTDIDYRYAFTNGNIGHQARGIRRDITLDIDHISPDLQRRLEHWMHQRALVWFSPNMGRNTVMSFRPVDVAALYSGVVRDTVYFGRSVDGTGTQATDITGVNDLDLAVNDDVFMWDRVKRRFIKDGGTDFVSANNCETQEHHTPGGAGTAYPMSLRNYMVPPYPQSATTGHLAGESGWGIWGTDAAQITFTHHSGEFGHQSCPDIIRVDYTNNVSASRAIGVSGVFNPASGDYGGITPTGAGTMSVCVWMRGQLTDSSSIELTGSTGTTTRDLSGLRLDGWTPIIINRHEADWSLSIPELKITLESIEGIAGYIEIGPTMISQESGALVTTGEFWTDSHSFTGDCFVISKSVQSISQGTMFASFFLPDWWGQDYASRVTLGVMGFSLTWSLRVGHLAGGTDFVEIEDHAGDLQTIYTAAGEGFNPGKINTVAFVWSGEHQRAYINGDVLGDVNRNSNEIELVMGDTRIGADGGSMRMFPGVLLTSRIDEGAMTDDEINNLHLALTDPVALQATSDARGRVYRIVGIPQTVRASAGGSQIIGQLKLEQVELRNWLTDPLNKEESIP